MRNFARALMLFSLFGAWAGAVAACGGDDPDPNNNNNNENRVVERYSGGGTGGGAIDGKFSLFVEDGTTSARPALPGATVIIEAGGMSMTETTDAEGRVDFEGDNLDGAI